MALYGYGNNQNGQIPLKSTRGALVLQCQFHGFVITVKFLLFSETRYLLY